MIENNFILLVFALVIFTINAFFRQNTRSFQITMIIFISLMIFAEIVTYFPKLNDSIITNNAIELKVQIQFVAMAFLLTAVWFRYYKISKFRKKMIETIDSLLK